MDVSATSTTPTTIPGADGAHTGPKEQLIPAKTAAAGVITSSSGRDPISPSPPPPPPPYDAALSMPLSPKRYRSTVDSRLTPPATTGPAGPGASAGAAGAATRGTTTKTVGGTDSSISRVSPSPPPSYVSWKSSSPKPRVETASPAGAGASAGAAAAAADAATERVLPSPPPPPTYEVIFSPPADKTSAAEQEQARVAEGGPTAGLPEHADAASNMIKDVAEDVAESVADALQAIGGVFGGVGPRKDGPDVATTATTGKGSFVADVDESDVDGDGQGDDGTTRQPGFASASANLDQGEASFGCCTGLDQCP